MYLVNLMYNKKGMKIPKGLSEVKKDRQYNSYSLYMC
jgi:hypothetical protein